jgi:nucleotide-binding universal stress UspA family protein
LKNFRKIICPVDFSEPSDAALRVAVDLADPFSVEIVLVHAINQIDPTPSPAYRQTHNVMEQIPQIMQQMTNNANNALKELIANHIADRVEVGDPATCIVKTAEEERADLIVIATHGRSWIKGFFFGSVPEKVGRTAGYPVLTVSTGLHGHG